MVRYHEIRPSGPLQSFVDSFWTLEHDGAIIAPQRVVPDGHPELILNLGQPFEYLQDGQWHRQPRSFFAGQIRGPLLLRPGGRAHIIGIRFHPYGAARVLGPEMHALAGRFTPISDLFPTLSRALDQALDSADPLPSIETALSLAAGTCRGIDPLVSQAVGRFVLDQGAPDICGLANAFGISTRQFERRFHASVGLPPKLFCRMQRFTRVFRAIGQEQGTWVDTAIASGYYDQAHLIRDFNSFAGRPPAALLAEDADLARHFLLRFGMSHSSKTVRRRRV